MRRNCVYGVLYKALRVAIHTMIYFASLLRTFACASRCGRRLGLCILPIFCSIVLHDTGDQDFGVSIGLRPMLVVPNRFEVLGRLACKAESSKGFNAVAGRAAAIVESGNLNQRRGVASAKGASLNQIN